MSRNPRQRHSRQSHRCFRLRPYSQKQAHPVFAYLGLEDGSASGTLSPDPWHFALYANSMTGEDRRRPVAAACRLRKRATRGQDALAARVGRGGCPSCYHAIGPNMSLRRQGAQNAGGLGAGPQEPAQGMVPLDPDAGLCFPAAAERSTRKPDEPQKDKKKQGRDFA